MTSKKRSIRKQGLCCIAGVLFFFSKSSFATEISSYIDGSYNYLQRSNVFISGVPNREFDLEPNGFTLQQWGLLISNKPTEGFGGALTLMMGRDALTTAAYGYHPATEFDSQTIAFDVLDADIQYARHSTVVMIGKYGAFAGNEYTVMTMNPNFSRSILYTYAEPGNPIGVRVTYSVTDKLKWAIGINNGWGSIRDWGRGPGWEIMAAYTLNPDFSMSIQANTSRERATFFTDFGPIGQRSLVNAFATWTATQKLSFIVDYDYGWQTTATLPTGNQASVFWQGIAGYVNYQFNDRWRSSLRSEIFLDQQGYWTGVRQNWREVTLTIGYAPIKSFEIRAETRRDFSNVHSFLDSNKMTASNNQQSYAVDALYKI